MPRPKSDGTQVYRLVSESLRQWAEWVWTITASESRANRKAPHQMWGIWEDKATSSSPVVTRVSNGDPVLAALLHEERAKQSLAHTVHLILMNMDVSRRYPMCAEELGHSRNRISCDLKIPLNEVNRLVYSGRRTLGRQLLNNPVVVRKYL